MSTRPTRSTTVVEGVRATGSHSDGAAPPRASRHTTEPFVSDAEQVPPDEAPDERPVSGVDEDTYLKLCDNLKSLKIGDLSDSFESADHESDTTGTQDSDTGSFYSVQSHRTETCADSFVSLLPSDSNSESTLYASAQSLQSALPHSLPSQSFISPHPVTREHRSSLTFLPGHTQRFDQVYLSDPLEEYTSLPNLSPLEQFRHTTSAAPVRCLAPAAPRLNTRRTMSTVDGTSSPKSPRSPRGGEEGEKKKKGLISSFRKSRKTGRKLRQQKKAAEEDNASGGIGINSDGEMFDSESSAPNSPAVVKSRAVGGNKDGEDTDEPAGVSDGHERLNGSAQRSKSPSPITAKSTRVEEGSKKGEEKEEKKRERSKFGSFLRKEKKIKDSAAKSSPLSNASTASSQATDSSSVANADGVSTSDSAELRQEEKEVKNDIEQATAMDDDVTPEPSHDVNRRPSDSKEPPQATSSSHQSQSSSIQFVRNLTVNTSVPKDKPAPEAKPKPDAGSDGGNVKPMEPADVKKNVKPPSTEVKSSRSSVVTSQQTEAYRLEQAYPLKAVKVEASPSTTPSRTVVRPSGGRTASTSSIPSRSSTPIPSRRLSLENASLSSSLKPERPTSLSSLRAVSPPVTITPPKEEAPHPLHGAVAAPSARPGASPNSGPAQIPDGASPPSSPEGHARDARETPEGDRSEGERNPLLDASGLNSDSWVWLPFMACSLLL